MRHSKTQPETERPALADGMRLSAGRGIFVFTSGGIAHA